MALNLETKRVHEMLKDEKTPEALYVLSLAEAIEILVSEDHERFSEYEDRFLQRLDTNTKGNTAQIQFLYAELHLQWAFICLKFGHELDAATNLRQAFQRAEKCRRDNPSFNPILKTTGILNVIIGSVPEKYDWLLNLLGMEGSLSKGMEQLEKVRNSNSSIADEADVLYALVQGYILQNTNTGLIEFKKLLEAKPGNKLLSFLGASLAIKNSESEVALNMLDSMQGSQGGIELQYDDYLRGEIYLHKGDYQNAISSYLWFVSHYKGENYIKDAHYKIGICYWLNQNSTKAEEAFSIARKVGREETEADKHAARNLNQTNLPNRKLSKVRYFTDGGYYKEAEGELTLIEPVDIPTKHEQVEFYYRKARLAHKQNQIAPAKLFYAQTIEMAGTENWYFAPNACLQLGYIAMAEGEQQLARSLFNRALSYKKHEYKNSIDSKAKSALAQLKTR